MTLDDIGEDIEADQDKHCMAKERPVKGVFDGLEEDGKQDKHSHCDECNQYFVLKVRMKPIAWIKRDQ